MKPSIKPEENRTFTMASVVYYYTAMLISILILFAGANLAAHGFLRATTDHTVSTITCLPPPAPRVTDPTHISDAERQCRTAEQKIQVRQGSFQVAQGLTMVVVAILVFSWHFKRIRLLELQLSHRSTKNTLA